MMIGLELWLTWPDWLKYLYLGLVWMFSVTAGGIILARIGLKPFWALLLILPYGQIIAFWLLAFSKNWPLEKINGR